MSKEEFKVKREPTSISVGFISKARFEAENKEVPMLFSTPMVQALLNGTKTETRRDKNLKEINENPDLWDFVGYTNPKIRGRCASFINKTDPMDVLQIKVPWEKGNLLWCKETWKPAIRLAEGAMGEYPMIRYKADSFEVPVPTEDYDWFMDLTKNGKYNYQSSMFMRRKFARIFLSITSISIERLQDIEAYGSLQEGIQGFTKDDVLYKFGLDGMEWQDMHKTAVGAYKMLWEQINGEGSWDKNPWCWVIKFSKIDNYGV